MIQRGANNETDTDDIITEYEYDEVTARLQTVTNGDSKVEYTYTTLGLIDTIKHNTSTATSDVVYTFVYDEFGNVSSIKVGNGVEYNNLAAYVYKDNNGQLEQVTYGTGENVEYEYDELGRVLKIKEDDVVKYSWEYGTDGRVGRFINHTLTVNGITRYEYDFNGNVVSEDRGNIHLFNEYDEKNLLRETGYEVGNVSVSTTFDYNAIDELENVIWNTNNTNGSVMYERDDLRRVNKTTYYSNSSKVLETTYEYLDAKNDNSKTTSAVEKVIQQYDSSPHEFTYSYNEFGNIVSIKNEHGSSVTNTYKYDKLNQLVRENNKELNKTFVYSYDNGGNITEVKTYDYTIADDLTGFNPSIDTYEYTDSKWKDLLTEFNDGSITYDEIGNPTEYHDGKVFTWEFRKLTKIVDGDTNIEYTYNQDSIRTSKKIGNTTTSYFVSGDRILYETKGNETIYYEYDGTGKVSGFVLGNNRYTYVKNGLNDIIEILDSSANLVATYKYDAWGNVSVNNLTNDNLGDKNSFRYRGYYYDSETGYYYLNSRYYDPEVKRFINSDGYVSTGQGILGHNMFAYCGNNPVTRIDNEGNFWDTVFDLISLAVSVVETILNPNDAWNWLGLAGDAVDLVPFVTGVGEAARGVKAVDKVTEVASTVNKGWKVGDNITDLTKQGEYPSWSTIRSRFWKNEALYNASKYSDTDLALMKKGRAPLVYFNENGKYYPMELHHRIAKCNGGSDDITNLLPVSPWEHDEKDPFRHFNPK